MTWTVFEINETAYRGLNVDDVVEQLQREFTDMIVDPVAIGSLITMEVNLDRLRVWYDPKDNHVTSVKQG